MQKHTSIQYPSETKTEIEAEVISTHSINAICMFIHFQYTKISLCLHGNGSEKGENETTEQKRNENKHENTEWERQNIKRIINYLHTNELDISEI